MTELFVRGSEPLSTLSNDAFVRLISSVGEDHFGPELAQFLNELCGADHFAAFSFGEDDLSEVVSCCVVPERTARDRVTSYVRQGWWKRDPAMTEAKRRIGAERPSIVHLDFGEDRYAAMRSTIYLHVRDRLLLCGQDRGSNYGLSLLRSDPHTPFAVTAIDAVADSAALILAILGKHADIRRVRPKLSQALASLGEILSCITLTSALPRREAEVCARILYGVSSAGIALDLYISEESVKTYRKRAYERLGIGSKRELFNWYIAKWDFWHCNATKLN